MNKIEKGFLAVVLLAILFVLILIYFKDCNCCCTNCVVSGVEIERKVIEITKEFKVTKEVEVTKEIIVEKEVTPTMTPTILFQNSVTPTSVKKEKYTATPFVSTNTPTPYIPVIDPTNTPVIPTATRISPTNTPNIPTEIPVISTSTPKPEHCNNGIGNGPDCPVNDQIDNDICGTIPCAKATANARKENK